LGTLITKPVDALFKPVDAEAILSIRLSSCVEDNVVAWLPEKTGIFSVRSAYKLGVSELPSQTNITMSSSRPEGHDLCWKNIWKSSVPPKVKNFAWKAASEALSTE
jgi:hypothetical protein